jgi:beta-xylosidase
MEPDGSRLLGDGVIIADGEERYPTIEGPKFLKRDGWYYVLAPSGGVATGWQMALRSRTVYGPYEARRVLEQGVSSVNGPHQGALVDTTDGRWWFLHFQDAGVYGRIMHLQPVTWRGGWPEMGVDRDGNGIGEPVDAFPKPVQDSGSVPHVPATTDTFSGPKLGLQWQWHANHADDWCSLVARPGHLRLFSQPTAADDFGLTPHLLLQKFPAREFSAETELAFSPAVVGAEAGLAVVGKRHAALAAVKTAQGRRLVLRIDNKPTAATEVPEAALRLRVSVRDNGGCRFSWGPSTAHEWTAIGGEFEASEGQWIGAKVGLFASKPESAAPADADADACFADFACFRFGPVIH